ncbi:MAG: hypothetical protein LBF63_08225 [Treponema sp.]|nr:hypothetical protein [Treponema sp.]
MLDPRIAKDPVRLIREKKKDGEFLFTQEECERWIEMILFDRAVALWAKEKPPELERREKSVRTAAPAPTPVFWKPTGRGKTFWVDSE